MMKKRFTWAVWLVVAIVALTLVLEARVYYCQEWGCAAGTLCGSSVSPRQIGTCIFECQMGSIWSEYRCQLEGGK